MWLHAIRRPQLKPVDGYTERMEAMLGKALHTKRATVFTSCRTRDPDMGGGVPPVVWNGAPPPLQTASAPPPPPVDVRLSARLQSRLARLHRGHAYSSLATQHFVDSARHLPMAPAEHGRLGRAAPKRALLTVPFERLFDPESLLLDSAEESSPDGDGASKRARVAAELVYGRVCTASARAANCECVDCEAVGDGLRAVYPVPVVPPAAVARQLGLPFSAGDGAAGAAAALQSLDAVEVRPWRVAARASPRHSARPL